MPTENSLSKIITKSRDSRLKMEQAQQNRVKSFFINLGRTVLEMIPGGLGPYGIGDLITLVEGIRGQEIFGGRKLDLVDRVISFIAALLPIVPATPFREAARIFRKKFEDSFTG